jgi:hypothetical protein
MSIYRNNILWYKHDIHKFSLVNKVFCKSSNLFTRTMSFAGSSLFDISSTVLCFTGNSQIIKNIIWYLLFSAFMIVSLQSMISRFCSKSSRFLFRFGVDIFTLQIENTVQTSNNFSTQLKSSQTIKLTLWVQLLIIQQLIVIRCLCKNFNLP